MIRRRPQRPDRIVPGDPWRDSDGWADSDPEPVVGTFGCILMLAGWVGLTALLLGLTLAAWRLR